MFYLKFSIKCHLKLRQLMYLRSLFKNSGCGRFQSVFAFDYLKNENNRRKKCRFPNEKIHSIYIH